MANQDSVIQESEANLQRFWSTQKSERIEKHIQVFPNPAEDYVQIELPFNETQCVVTLLTCTGDVVKSHEFTGISTRLNLSDVQSGIYILRVVYYQNIETFKLVVQ